MAVVPVPSVPDDTNSLVSRAAAGDSAVMGELLSRYRERLRTMVRLRLDRRLQGRVDPSDVVQEAFLEASKRIAGYAGTAAGPPEAPGRPAESTAPPPPANAGGPGRARMPFFLWLRFLTTQHMLIARRRHLGTKMRDAGGEVSLYRKALPEATTLSLAAQLLGQLTSPTQAAARAELQLQLQQALNSMDATDREVLVLRHFEELNNNETADVLGISKTAASNRYVRALRRLREIVAGVAEFREWEGRR